MAKGARDTVEDAAQSDCFYAVYGLVDTADLMMYDFKNVASESGSLNWFNVAAYDPLHFSGDSMVSYQYCGGTSQLNNATSLASSDYAYTSQFVSNQFTYLLTQTGDLKKRFKDAQYEAELPLDHS